MQAGALSLNFNCSCWQNRKARIYLSGPEFDETADQTFRKSLEQGSTKILLCRPHLGKPTHIFAPDGTDVTMYSDRTSLPVLALPRRGDWGR